MEAIVALFTGLSSTDVRKDDDFVDRLNSKYSVLVLLVFAIVVSMHQYVGSPITCWAPQEYTSSHIKYMNAYCWVRNTYYVPFDDRLPKADATDQGKMVPYYQWIPFLLLSQALLFYLPSVLWHSFNQKAGVDADNIMAYAQTFTKADRAKDRQNTLIMIRNQLDRFLVTRKPLRKEHWKKVITQRGLFGRRFGSYLMLLYIATKILYLANAVFQLVVLNRILAVDYGLYGIEVIFWMLRGTDWTESPSVAFPRVTICNYKIRQLGNVHRHTVQCTLPINLYTEKIYMFLWWWLMLVAVCSSLSLLIWLGRLIYSEERVTYVRNHLKTLEKLNSPRDNEYSVKFVKNYLKVDGVFILRLIGHNTNSLSVSDIVGALWDLWITREADRVNCTTVSCIEERPLEKFVYVNPIMNQGGQSRRRLSSMRYSECKE